MKKRPYDILLVKSEKQLAFMPRKKNFVTVVKVAGGKVSSVEFINKLDQLAKVF